MPYLLILAAVFFLQLLTLFPATFSGKDVHRSIRAPDNKIINGTLAEKGQFPWIAYLRCENDKNVVNCTGSLLHKKFILTSAHCVYKTHSCKVMLGAYNMDHIDHEAHHETSTNFHHHPCYVKNIENTSRWDLGLVELSGTLNYSPNIIPISLAQFEESSATYAGRNVTSLGWGLMIFTGRQTTRVLIFMGGKILERERCGPDNMGDKDETIICASGFLEMTCTCDTGGPVVLYEGAMPIQIGINAFAATSKRGCESSGVPHGYVKIASNLDWIRATIKAEKYHRGNCFAYRERHSDGEYTNSHQSPDVWWGSFTFILGLFYVLGVQGVLSPLSSISGS